MWKPLHGPACCKPPWICVLCSLLRGENIKQRHLCIVWRSLSLRWHVFGHILGDLTQWPLIWTGNAKRKLLVSQNCLGSKLLRAVSTRRSHGNFPRAVLTPGGVLTLQTVYTLSRRQLQNPTSSNKIDVSCWVLQSSCCFKLTAKNQYKPFLTATAKLNVKRHIEMLLDICSWLQLFLQLTAKPSILAQYENNFQSVSKKVAVAVDVDVTNMKTPGRVRCFRLSVACAYLPRLPTCTKIELHACGKITSCVGVFAENTCRREANVNARSVYFCNAKSCVLNTLRGFHVGAAVNFFLTLTATFLMLTADLFSHWWHQLHQLQKWRLHQIFVQYIEFQCVFSWCHPYFLLTPAVEKSDAVSAQRERRFSCGSKATFPTFTSYLNPTCFLCIKCNPWQRTWSVNGNEWKFWCFGRENKAKFLATNRNF